MTSSIPGSSRLQRLLGLLELDPNNLTLRLDAIRESVDNGEWDIGRQLIDAGLRAHPDEPNLLGWSGFAHLHAQQYVDAEQTLRAAVTAGLEAPELSYNLAFALFMQRRYADALEYVSATQAQSDETLAAILRARCLHHLRRPQEAIDDLKLLLASAPEEAEAHGLLALIAHEQGAGDAAREHVEAALKRDPRQFEALLVLAYMQSNAQEPDFARASFDALLSIDPQCGRAWLGVALLELKQMDLTAAKRNIEAAAAHMPEHIGTWHVLAWTELLLGDVAAAHTAFEKALAVDRNFGESHGGLAIIAALQGRDEEARLGIRRALRLDGKCLSAKYAEMVLLRRHGRHQDAQAVFESALSQTSGSGTQIRELVIAQMRYLSARRDDPQIVYH